LGSSLAFGGFSHGIEFRHIDQQLVERVGHQLLRRAAIDRASEPQPEVPAPQTTMRTAR